MRACWKHDEWEKGQRRKWETIKLRRGVTRRNWKRRRLINSCYLRIGEDLVNSRAIQHYIFNTKQSEYCKTDINTSCQIQSKNKKIHQILEPWKRTSFLQNLVFKMLYLWLTELNLLMPLDMMMDMMKRWGHFHWTHLPLTRDCICHPCHAFWLSTNLVLNGDSKKQALHYECYDGDIDVSADNCNWKWENDSFWCYGRHKEDIRINYVPILVQN